MIADVEKVKNTGVAAEITRIVPEAVEQPVEVLRTFPFSYHRQHTRATPIFRADAGGAHRGDVVCTEVTAEHFRALIHARPTLFNEIGDHSETR
jgi:hypothetical protein